MQELQEAYDTCTRLCSSLSAMLSDLMAWLPPTSLHTDGCRVAVERLTLMWRHADKSGALLRASPQANVSVPMVKELMHAMLGDIKSL